MNIATINKVREGKYTISSVPCPKCNGVLTLEIDGYNLYKYNQGASVTTVLPNESLATCERFISGYCQPCWTDIFGEDTDDDEDY